MCPLLSPHFKAFFLLFLLQPLTVLMRQTRQEARAINQSIFLRSLWVKFVTNIAWLALEVCGREFRIVQNFKSNAVNESYDLSQNTFNKTSVGLY